MVASGTLPAPIEIFQIKECKSSLQQKQQRLTYTPRNFRNPQSRITSPTTAHQPTILQHRRDLSVPATLEAHTATVIQKRTKRTLFMCNFYKDAGSCFNGQNRDYFCLFSVLTSGTSTSASPVGPSPTECQALAALRAEEQDRPSDLHWFSASFPTVENRSYNITLPY